MIFVGTLLPNTTQIKDIKVIVTNRKYESKDYGEVINFFRRLYRTSNGVPHWLPARFEYAVYLVSPLHKQRGYPIDWKETIYLWEKDGSEVVAVACSEDPDKNVFIHTLPDFRNLEEEMIKVAEECIVRQTLRESKIDIWCQEVDVHRETILYQLGYRKKMK